MFPVYVYQYTFMPVAGRINIHFYGQRQGRIRGAETEAGKQLK